MFQIFGKKEEKPKESSTVVDNVYYYEDYLAKNLTELNVGRKGLSLFETKDMDVPVPPFFVISPDVYKDIIFKAFDKNIVMLLESNHLPDPKQMAELVLKSRFDLISQEEILRNYSRLSGFSDAWVSVRSSVVFPERPDVSFSGIFATELNVRGFDNLLEAIKLVYASIFTDKVALYAKSQGINLTNLKIAVAVQKMVQAEVSGVVYTIDPVTNDETKLSIETVFGLGDAITNGELTPDRYLLNKKDLSFVEKHIAPQEWMRVRTLSTKKTGQHFGSVEKIQISTNWSHQQKLEDRFVEDVAKVALIIEEKSGMPHDIEWVWESGNVWILQTKPINHRVNSYESSLAQHPLISADFETQKNDVVNSSDLVDLAAEVVREVKREEIEAVIEEVKEIEQNKVLEEQNNDIISATEIIKPETVQEEVNDESLLNKDFAELKFDNTEAINELQDLDDELQKLTELLVVKDIEKHRENEIVEAGKEEIAKLQLEKEEITGVNIIEEQRNIELVFAGQGASFGKTIGEVRYLSEDVDVSKISADLLTKRNILVVEKYSEGLDKVIFAVGGVILKSGGLTSDVAVICREMNIPAVVGVGDNISKLVEGDVVEIDGNFGSVYRYQSADVESLKTTTNDAPNITNTATASELYISKVNEENIVNSEASDVVQAVGSTSASIAKDIQLHQETEVILANLTSDSINQVEAEEDEEAKPEKLFTATKLFIQQEKGYQEKDLMNYRLSDGIFYLDLDRLFISDGKHPLEVIKNSSSKEFTDKISQIIDYIASNQEGNEVVLSVGALSVEDFRKLPNGHLFEEVNLVGDTHGASRLLKSPNYLKKVITVLKKIRNVFRNRNVSLAIHSPINLKTLLELKKEFAAAGIRRNSTFNIYAIIESPAEILMIEDLLNADIDGVILNMKNLACEIQGLNVDDQNAKYDLATTSVLKLVDTVTDAAKKDRNKVVVLAENSKQLIMHSVRKGVYGITVDSNNIENCRRIIAQEEANIILGR